MTIGEQRPLICQFIVMQDNNLTTIRCSLMRLCILTQRELKTTLQRHLSALLFNWQPNNVQCDVHRVHRLQANDINTLPLCPLPADIAHRDSIKENLQIERRPSFFAFAGIGTKRKSCAASVCRFPPPPPTGESPLQPVPQFVQEGVVRILQILLFRGKCFRKG